MDIANITFPLYKLRSYINIERNPLGVVKVTTIKGIYILDDHGIEGNFETRRTKLQLAYPTKKIYKLKERVLYLRQLFKYKSGTTFIDITGKIVKYKKSSKLYTVKSMEIHRKKTMHNWTILYCTKIEIPFLIGKAVTYETKYASIMYTEWGPFLYDLTSERHEPYKRKI